MSDDSSHPWSHLWVSRIHECQSHILYFVSSDSEICLSSKLFKIPYNECETRLSNKLPHNVLLDSLSVIGISTLHMFFLHFLCPHQEMAKA